jgi:hypothetical protein
MGQTLAPLRTLASFGTNVQSYDQLAAIPGGTIAVGGEVVLNLAFLALQVTVVAVMYRRSVLFPKFFLFQLLAMIAVFVLEILLVSASLGIAVNKIITPDTAGGEFGALLGTALWTLYVFRSRRVQNTFVRGAASTNGLVGENG